MGNLSFDELKALADNAPTKGARKQAEALLKAQARLARMTDKVAMAVTKTPVDRFTVVDGAGGKRIAIRTPGAKGAPRQVDPADLGTEIAKARKVLEDLEGAQAFATEQGLA